MYDTLRHYWWEMSFDLFFHKWCWVNLLLCSQNSISEVAGHGLSSGKIWIYFLFAWHSNKIVALIDFSSILYTSLLTLTWWSFSSVQFSRSVVSNSLQLHEPQHARPPCPSPTPGVYSSQCPLSRWCHPTISSSVIPFSSCPQSFQMSQLFTLGAKVLEFQLPHQSFQWTPRTDLL